MTESPPPDVTAAIETFLEALQAGWDVVHRVAAASPNGESVIP